MDDEQIIELLSQIQELAGLGLEALLGGAEGGAPPEGEMPPEIALDPASHPAYAFNRLSKPANILVMPAIHSAAISTKLVQALGGAAVIGPLLVGLEKSVQIVPLGASVSEIITAATFAAYHEGPVFHGEGVSSAPKPPAPFIED